MTGSALSRRISKITFPERDPIGAWIARGTARLTKEERAELIRLRGLVVDGDGVAGLSDADFARLQALIATIDATPDRPPNFRLEVRRAARIPRSP